MGELSSIERDSRRARGRRADARPGARLGRGQQRLAQPRRARAHGGPAGRRLRGAARRAAARRRRRRSKRSIAPGRTVDDRARPAPASDGAARRRRCSCCFTGHMDTVFGADHAFQETRWLEDGVLNGPGVADMKGGIAVMLAALKAVEASPLADRLGYEVVINSDEEVGSLGLGGAARASRAGQARGADLRACGAARRDARRRAARERQFLDSSCAAASAHAGRNPEDGRNALLAAADLALRLDGAEARRPERQSGADRRRRPEQCRARPRRAARQPAPARRRTIEAEAQAR